MPSSCWRFGGNRARKWKHFHRPLSLITHDIRLPNHPVITACLDSMNLITAFLGHFVGARIWELGIGALVFLASRRMQSVRIQETLRRLSPFALLGLIACFFAPESYAVAATLAVVGLTALLLASDDRSLAASVLKLPPVVYIGRISYSLYLWHWPIIALGPIVLATAWRSSAVYVVAMAIAAVLSFHRKAPAIQDVDDSQGR